MEDKWRQDLGEADKPSNTGSHVRRQWETRGDKDVGKADAPSNKGKQEGRWETRGNKTSGRRTHHPTQADKGRQDRGKADTPSKAEAPSNTGTHVGRQGETRPREGGHTIQHRHAYLGRQWETMKNKTSGRWTIQHRHTCWETMGDNWRQWETMGNNWRQPETRIDKKGDNGRQGETRPREGGHTIQHRHTCGETMGENGEQWGTMGDQGRHLEKAGTPSKQGKQEGRWETIGETRPWKGGHAIQHKRIL